jgi:hypothetical protein
VTARAFFPTATIRIRPVISASLVSIAAVAEKLSRQIGHRRLARVEKGGQWAEAQTEKVSLVDKVAESGEG